jgi:hypothetical protein
VQLQPFGPNCTPTQGRTDDGMVPAEYQPNQS